MYCIYNKKLRTKLKIQIRNNISKISRNLIYLVNSGSPTDYALEIRRQTYSDLCTSNRDKFGKINSSTFKHILYYSFILIQKQQNHDRYLKNKKLDNVCLKDCKGMI